MIKDADDKFYERADAHIHLSNDQISEDISNGHVSVSFMYSLARFNAWVNACDFSSGNEMAEAKTDTIEYFVTEYRKMLEENLNDYIANFDSYMNAGDKNTH
ncbi:hypothetical protein MNBD_GAMMA09-1911 [hydrothermal vent metagenome]|uniref:DUF3144 domain-containing protein n=1 Tax=hydrothermal vent metagenome TaxID=652676 RepID=A0A3B0XXR7_9ZZZZ